MLYNVKTKNSWEVAIMLKKCKARIEKIAKDDIKLCSSRCIWADLRDENDVLYHVKWAETPSVVGITGNWSSREPYAFENALPF